MVATPDKPPHPEPEAERLWDAIVPELERLRLVPRLDGVTLELLCTTYTRWRQHDGGLGYPALTNVLANLARDVGLAPPDRAGERSGRARAFHLRFGPVSQVRRSCYRDAQTFVGDG